MRKVRSKSNELKDQIINFRVSAKQKAEYKQMAQECGLDVSKLIEMALNNHAPIAIKIDGGEKLAEELYKLNKTLNQHFTNPDIPVTTIRNSIDKIVNELNGYVIERR